MVGARRELVVPEGVFGQRLDVFLAGALEGLSRSRLKALIDDGQVTVDGAPARASRKVVPGEVVVVIEPPPPPAELIAEDLELSVLYEDEHLLVVDKPAGMVVHPGAGNPRGTLANAIRFRAPHVIIGGEERPGIVHRLDKDTSGALVVALDDETHRALSRAFQEREVEKTYLAFCLGRPRKEEVELITGHARHAVERKRFTTKLPAPEEGGPVGGVRRAHTRFRVLRSAEGVSELEVHLITGRTHQIRAHLADYGYPLVHDELYGGGRPEKRLREGAVRDAVRGLERQALHAWRLAFTHPKTGERLSFEAPLPEDLARLERALALEGEV